MLNEKAQITSSFAKIPSSLAFPLLLSAALLSTAGCAVDVTDGESSDEEHIGTAEQRQMVDPTTQATLPPYGGSGGDSYPNTQCPLGYVATGFNLRISTWINSIQFNCRELRSDGTLGATVPTAARGRADGIYLSAGCPDDQIMVSQMIGTDGQFVGKLGAECASLSRVLAKVSGSDSSLGPFGAQGTLYKDHCPPGMAVTGFVGRFGAWTDQVAFVCNRLLMPYVALPASSSDGGLPITISSLTLPGGGNTLAHVLPGQSLTTKFDYSITQTSGCPTCIDQILVGFAPNNPQQCIYSGIPSLSGTSGSTTVTLTAPSTPGLYFIRYHYGMDYYCNLDMWNAGGVPTETQNIGVINVF